MKADSNIFFLTLPENLDPDAYINQKGKDSFINFVQSKIDIQNFNKVCYSYKLNDTALWINGFKVEPGDTVDVGWGTVTISDKGNRCPK